MHPLLLLAMAVGAILLFENTSSATNVDPGGDPVPDPGSPEPGSPSGATLPTPANAPGMPVSADQSGANSRAFLAMLRVSEGTARASNPYAVLFGGTDGSSYGTSDHPANLGWKGVQYTDRNGKTWIATAAGAYQFVKATWNGIGMPDFSPASQDEAAMQLIAEAGALTDVEQGNFANAVAKLGNVWASLPSSTAAQPTQQASTLLSAYLSAGGTDNAGNGIGGSTAVGAGEGVTDNSQPTATQIDLSLADPTDSSDDSGDS